MVLLAFFSCWVKESLARKLFGSVSEALTFREELETRKTFGLVAKALTFGEELMLTRDTGLHFVVLLLQLLVSE